MSKTKSNTHVNPTFIRTIRLLTPLALFLTLHSFHMPATAQSDTTPDSEEITRLKDKKTRVELERDIEKAEKEKREAQFPKSSTSPLSGETKIDGATIESDMVSYVSMAHAADRIARDLRHFNRPIRNLAIYSKPDIDLLLNYKVTTSQLEIARKQYCSLLKSDPRCQEGWTEARNRLHLKGTTEFGESSKKSIVGSVLSSMSIGGSLLGAFVDMTALLRTNVTLQGHTIDIGESAFVSELFRALRSADGLGRDTNLFYPAAFSPNIDVNTPSAILGQLQDLHELKARATALFQGLDDNLKKTKKAAAKIEEMEAAIQELQLVQKRRQDELNNLLQTQRVFGRRTPFAAYQRIQELKKLMADYGKDMYQLHKALDAKNVELRSLETKQANLLAQLGIDLQKADVEETITRLKLMNDRFDQFVANLVKVEAATGINSLTAFIKAENLNQALKEGNGEGYWLQLAVIKAGGNNRIKSNLITDIFTAGSRVSHSGGAIVQYNLYDLNGRSLVSDTLTQYEGYVKSGKIKKLPNPGSVERRPDDQATRKVGPRDSRVAKTQF